LKIAVDIEGCWQIKSEQPLGSMEWKDSGDISNVNSLPREVLQEPDCRCISPNMSGDTITEQIQKESRFRKSSSYWKRVRGGNGTLPMILYE